MNLTERAIIISLSISEWLGRKLDRDVTREVDETHNTVNAGSYSKNLIELSHLAKISHIRGKLRSLHNSLTLPWGDGGDRLLPAAMYLYYEKKMYELIVEFNEAVEEFLAKYIDLKTDAKYNLKEMYKESDYPSVENIRSRFGVYTTKQPIPQTNDFRLELDNSHVSILKTQIENDLNERHVKAVEDISQRIKDAIMRVITSLDKEDPKFKRSMIDNIETLVEIIPAMNYTGDTRIAKLAKELESLLIDPEHIRNDKDIRANVLQRAKELNEMYF